MSDLPPLQPALPLAIPLRSGMAVPTGLPAADAGSFAGNLAGSSRVDVLGLAERRLAWLDRRQGVLAQNIANANTPGFQVQDAIPFAQVLRGSVGASMQRTSPMHLVGTLAADGAQRDRSTDRSLDGNTVKLDEQAMKVAETDTAQSLAVALHRKYLALYRTALGR